MYILYIIYIYIILNKRLFPVHEPYELVESLSVLPVTSIYINRSQKETWRSSKKLPFGVWTTGSSEFRTNGSLAQWVFRINGQAQWPSDLWVFRPKGHQTYGLLDQCVLLIGPMSRRTIDIAPYRHLTTQQKMKNRNSNCSKSWNYIEIFNRDSLLHDMLTFLVVSLLLILNKAV